MGFSQKMNLVTLFSTFYFLVATMATNEIHPLPSGTSGRYLRGMSCMSWQFGVEAHNIIDWKTVPLYCRKHVAHYMLGNQYRKDSKVVANEAWEYAKGIKIVGDGKDVWVFDVDETSLSNIHYYAKHAFGAEPFNSTLFNEWVFEGKAPALAETRKLYNKLVSMGFKIVFLTGRDEMQRDITATNLKKVGYHTWEKLLLKGPHDKGATAVAYKSRQREGLEREGYIIWGNIGDEWSDILGTHVGNRTFKLPDPMYYIS